uniref:Sodium:neurotransmitter symporter family protein n=1 Tax=Panagrellus redivivus TaxID=6233 RepID=A0A7E4VI80_PANRE
MSGLIVEEWRDLWSFKAEFLVAAFAYVFATTNFLNLPRLILDNGGFAFVSAYGAALLAVVLPVLILEFSVGQSTGRAPIQALYNICPVFKGVGVAQILFSLLVLATMARYLGWLLLYVFHLFWTVIDERPGLPWLHCKNFPELQSLPCREAGAILNISASAAVKLTATHDESSLSQFMRALEHPSSNIADFGHFQYYILAAQGAVWLAVFIAICFGVRWLGKVVSVTFLLPVILLTAICIKALLLRGSWSVFKHCYDITDWQVLADYRVWKAAIEQAVLASGIGFGAFITIGSYNKRSNNLVGDSILLLFVHSLLTLFQVCTVFGVAGFIALRTGRKADDLIASGETQMWHFLSYLSYLPHVKVYSGIVLFMAIFVLLNIFYLLSLNILSSFEDALGVTWTKCVPRFFLALFVALFGFALGIYFTTQAGKHAYELATGYAKYLTLWTILACELIAVAWFYCAHNLGKDLRTMLKPGCCWCLGYMFLGLTYLLPLLPIAIAVFNVLAYSYEAYSEPIRRFAYSEFIGAAVALVPLLPIPLFALYAIIASCRTSGLSKAGALKAAFKSPMRYDMLKNAESASAQHAPRYSSAAPGYVLLPQHSAPLAEPEMYNEQNRNSIEVKVTEIEP